MIWVIVAALVIGLLLIVFGRTARRDRGLGRSRTLALDNRTLYSARLGLVGRPDRIVEGNIPEEWKSGSRVYDSHRAQLAAYFVLIAEETGEHPAYGFISLASCQRVRVQNTPEIREWVLEIAD